MDKEFTICLAHVCPHLGLPGGTVTSGYPGSIRPVMPVADYTGVITKAGHDGKTQMLRQVISYSLFAVHDTLATQSVICNQLHLLGAFCKCTFSSPTPDQLTLNLLFI